MIRYLTDNELVEREKMYFDAQARVLHHNLGKALNELHSLNNILYPSLPDTKNMIEHAAEKIFHTIYSESLGWPNISLPCCADSLYDCGDALSHVDVKTYLDSEGKKINVEKNQTSYCKGLKLHVGKNGNEWEPNLNIYEKHMYNGYIPNLTYAIKLTYGEVNHQISINSISLISIPNGQLAERFNYESILSAGKTKNTDGSAGNIRFNIDEIVRIEPWRVKVIYKKICSEIEAA